MTAQLSSSKQWRHPVAFVCAGVMLMAISAAHAQMHGINTTSTNLEIGANGQAFMAIGTDGAIALGTSTPGVGYDSSVANNPSVYGAGALNLNADGILGTNFGMITIGTITPRTIPYLGMPPALTAPAVITVDKTWWNAPTAGHLISNMYNDNGSTLVGFRNSQLGWTMGIGNATLAGLQNKFYIGNDNPALIVDQLGHVAIGGSPAGLCSYIPPPAWGWPACSHPNYLDVFGNVAIGAAYAGLVTAPANGLIVQGQTLIGGGSQAPMSANAELGIYGFLNVQNQSTLPSSASVGLLNANSAFCIRAYDKATGTGELAVGTYSTSGSCANSLFFWQSPDHGPAVGIGVDPVGNSLDVANNVSIGFGATPPVAPTGGLLVNGAVGIGTTTVMGSNALTVYATGSGAYAQGGFTSASDRRLKKDIRPYAFKALALVQQLKPVTFVWKQAYDDGRRHRHIGFIAQEVQDVIPEAVVVEDDAQHTLALSYDSLIPVLTKAIQELHQNTDAARSELSKVRAEQAALWRTTASRPSVEP
jgi:hypothetical protein